MNLIDHATGNYQFLSGIAPYSAGVIAQPGYEVVRVTLHQPLPYRAGFERIDAYLAAQERPLQALCAVELRLPAARTFAGFAEFNAEYQTLLVERDLLQGRYNPIARTNVAPAVQPPGEPMLYAFSYTRPSLDNTPTFIVAGAGDLRDQAILSAEAVVRPGETSLDALREKVATVMAVMQERLFGLGRAWDEVTVVSLYTTQNIQPLLAEAILQPIGAAVTHGVHWFYSQPPIADLIFEMDLRGIQHELRLTA